MAQEVTRLKGIEQGRATYAFDVVNEINKTGSKSLKESYKSVAKKLPVLIKTNGLGQTLAFVKSKGAKKGKPKNGYDQLYTQIGTWLQTKNPQEFPKDCDAVERIVQLESPNYRQVTIETIALLNWMRRFVEGLMKGVKNTESNDA